MPECAVPDAVSACDVGVGQLRDGRARAVEHAGRRPRHDQPPRAERRGQMRGEDVSALTFSSVPSAATPTLATTGT